MTQYIIDDTNKPVELDPEVARTYGAREATSSEIAAAEEAETYGGTLGTIGAFGAGALREGTLGLSDVVGQHLGVGDDLAKLKEYNPYATMAGRVGGGLIGAGKFGLATRALGGARLAAGLGRGASAALGGGVAGMAAGAAVEGAMSGVTNVISESALDNKAITGERLVTEMGSNALLAGALGGGLGVLAKGAGSLAKARAARELTEATTGKATDVGMLGRAYASLSSAVSGKDKGLILKHLGSEGAERMAIVRQGSSKLDEVEGAYLTALERHVDDMTRVQEEMMGLGKHGNISKLVTRGNEDVTRAAANGALDELTDTLNKIRGGDEYLTKGLKDLEGELAAVRANIAKTGDNATIMSQLDGIKRKLGNTAYGSKHYGATASGRAGATYRELDRVYEQTLRPLLEDGNLWGKAGKMQSEVNGEWAKFIAQGRDSGLTGQFVKRQVGDKGGRHWRFNAEAARKHLKSLTPVEREAALESMQEYFANASTLAQRIADNPNITDAIKDAAQGLGKHSDEVVTKVGEYAKVKQALSDWDLLRASDGDGSLSGQGLAYLLGSSGMDYATFGASSAAIGALRNPAGALQRLASIKSLVSRGGTAQEDAVRRALTTTKSSRGQATRTIVRSGTQSANLMERYHNVSDALVGQGANDRRDDLKASLAPLEIEAPGVWGEALAAHNRAVEYLITQLPDVGAPMSIIDPPPSPSRSEALTFMRKVDVVTSPNPGRYVAELLADEDLTVDHIEALEGAFPEMYSELQGQVVDMLTGLYDRGGKVSYAKRIQMGNLLRITSDATLHPDVVSSVVAAQKQAPEDDRPTNNVPRLSEAYQTDTQRISRS